MNGHCTRFNIADAPEKIDCGSIVRMAKEVNDTLKGMNMKDLDIIMIIRIIQLYEYS